MCPITEILIFRKKIEGNKKEEGERGERGGDNKNNLNLLKRSLFKVSTKFTPIY